jgi:predicted metalloprotease with PDZ domain
MSTIIESIEQRQLKRVPRFAAGDRVRVHAFRRDELIVADVTLAEAARDACYLVLQQETSPQTRARRDAWLGAT